MPHLRFRAVEAHIVESLVPSLLNELSSLLSTSRNAFTFELINTQYFAEGRFIPWWKYCGLEENSRLRIRLHR
ncbi:hypothetical protein VCSRO69_1864 [Vibrio cholerae]|nr:hypothetical protein VCSRO69_1864 [Vibrio cholerae]